MKRKTQNMNKSSVSVNEASETEPLTVAPQATGLTRGERLWVIAFGVLLFLSMTVQTGRVSVILCALAVVSLVVPKGRKPLIVCVPVIGFLLYGILFGLSAALTPFELCGYQEVMKFMAAFAVTVILLTHFEKKQIPALLWVFATVMAAISLLCVDMDASGLIFKPFNAFVSQLGISYQHLVGQISEIRITGLYNDPNVTGCMAGIGALISLYLLIQANDYKRRFWAAILIGVNAMNFFLSMSRGAILCFAIACVVWLIVAEKGTRLALFFRMVECAVAVMALSAVAMPNFYYGAVLPTVLTLVCGVLIFACDQLLSHSVVRLFAAHGKASVVTVAAIIVLFAVYGVAALTITGPGTITDEKYHIYSRAHDLPAGTYTLSGEWGDLDKIMVQWVDEVNALQGDRTTLYDGDPDTVSFTVPEGKGQLWFWFVGPVGTEIISATCSDGSEITMDYPLLPSFISERMQEDLFSSGSFLLRRQYDIDAFKIFLTSPIIGRGIGSSEELFSSVQPFYYESKYVHNHILQVMSDLGLVGLIAFAAFLGGSLYLIVKALRKKGEDSALAAILLTVWVLINLHSLIEINFNIRAFQCFAYGLMSLPVLQWATPLISDATAKQRKYRKLATGLCTALFAVSLAVFGTQMQLHRMIDRQSSEFETSSFDEYMTTLEKYIRLDCYNDEIYMNQYISHAVDDKYGKYRANMLHYVNHMERMATYSALSGLAESYYMPLQRWDDMFRCTLKGLDHETSTADAWDFEILYYRDTALPYMGVENVDTFIQGMIQIADKLDDVNSRMLIPVTVSTESQEFLQLVRDADNGDVAAYEQLIAYASAEA